MFVTPFIKRLKAGIKLSFFHIRESVFALIYVLVRIERGAEETKRADTIKDSKIIDKNP